MKLSVDSVGKPQIFEERLFKMESNETISS